MQCVFSENAESAERRAEIRVRERRAEIRVRERQSQIGNRKSQIESGRCFALCTLYFALPMDGFMPQPILKLIAIAVSLGWLGLILELVRRGRLREDHALLWLLTGVALLLFSIFEGALRFVADLIGVVYAPSILFGVGMLFAVLILLFQGITISRLQAQNKELAQDVALLTWEVQQLQQAGQAEGSTSAADESD